VLYGSLKTGIELRSKKPFVHQTVGTGQYIIIIYVKEPSIPAFKHVQVNMKFYWNHNDYACRAGLSSFYKFTHPLQFSHFVETSHQHDNFSLENDRILGLLGTNQNTLAISFKYWSKNSLKCLKVVDFSKSTKSIATDYLG
jgi:hypothetical protein